jgi:membrane protein DedA with SNARE-associated domain
MLRFQLANLSGALVAGLLAWRFPIFHAGDGILGVTVWAIVCIIGIYLLFVVPDLRRRKQRLRGEVTT